MRVKKVFPRVCREADPSGATYYPSAGSWRVLGAIEVLITGTTPAFAGAGSGTTSYYAFAGAMVAMRTTPTATLTYLHGDHLSASLRAGLGSTSLTTNASGQKVSEQPFGPFGKLRVQLRAGCYKPGACPERQRGGEMRWTSGAGPANYVGSLMDYVARGYSPALGRFISADTIVPTLESSIALNRYAYVFDSPLVYQDPSGHCAGISVVLCIAVAALLVSGSTNETPRLTPSLSGAPDKFDGKSPVLAECSHEMTDGSPYQQIATVSPGSDGTGGGGPEVGNPPGSGVTKQTLEATTGDGGPSKALRIVAGSTASVYPYSSGSATYGSDAYSIRMTAESAGIAARERVFDGQSFESVLASVDRPAVMRLPLSYLNGASYGIYGSPEREVFAVLRGLSPDKKRVIFDNPVDGLGKIELPIEFFQNGT